MLTVANSMTQFGLMIKLTQVNPSNSTETILTDLVNTLVQGIQVLEYIILFYTFSSFLGKMDSIKTDMLKELALSSMCRKWRMVLIVMLLLVYFIMLLVSPSLYILTWIKSRDRQDLVPYIYYYTGTLYASHITNGVVRVGMIITALIIMEAWKSARCNLPNLPQNLTDERELRGYFTSLLTNYTKSGCLCPWSIRYSKDGL